jgi:hypothetical protein
MESGIPYQPDGGMNNKIYRYEGKCGDANKNINTINKFWEGLIGYFLLIRHRPQRKRRDKYLFYCCVCIRC